MRRFLTPRWLWRHTAMLGLVATFLSLGWWQVDRARGGNMLSFGYALEWPLFALFVIFVWYREIRSELRDRVAGRGASTEASRALDTDPSGTDPTTAGLLTAVPVRRTPPGVTSPAPAATTPGAPGGSGVDPPGQATDPRQDVARRDVALDEYNSYLAWLAAHPDQRTSDYPSSRAGR